MNNKPILMQIHFESEFTEGYYADSHAVALARYGILKDCFGGCFSRVLLLMFRQR